MFANNYISELVN